MESAALYNLRMTKLQGWIAIVLLLGVATLLIADLVRVMPPPAYRYNIVYYRDQAPMNQDGAVGWEIVSARWAHDEVRDAWGYECIVRHRQ